MSKLKGKWYVICFVFNVISKLAFRSFDLILSNTVFSSHIIFISRCLHRKVIPYGFMSSFNPLRFNLPAFHRCFSHSVSEACSSHSRRLMHMTIKSMSIHVQHIDDTGFTVSPITGINSSIAPSRSGTSRQFHFG